jgi:beta-phosphoglucomutase-like phosphatase (HAD superfamily)
MDGVLVDSMMYHAQAWIQVSSEVGVKVAPADIYEIEGANHRLGLEWLFKRAGRDFEPEMYEKVMQRKIEIFYSCRCESI